MPQKTIQQLDAYIKATAAVYDHSNSKLVSRKTKVSRRRKEAFLSVLPYRKPSSHCHSPERRTSSSRKPRSKPAKESVISNPKQKLNISVQTPENANDDAPQTLSFQLDPGTSVQSLKELIEKQIGVEARRQRLHTRQNFQLCDLLTVEENGVDKDEIISLRLSKNDENCDEVPKEQATIDGEYLKDLSSKIQPSWKELAKHLGYEEADIQTTNEGGTEENRHMLLTWWEKATDRDEAAQKLRRALEAIELTELANNIPVTSELRDEGAGPEPERRQDAGVDEESKPHVAAAEEEKLKKEQVCDQDKPQPFCFRFVQVFIRCHLSHRPKTLCFRMNAETSVFTLKHMINEKISVQPQQQRLYIRRNFRKFELCNLLTLQDCGIHQDENITLRLCTDGLLGGGPTGTLPEDRSVWNMSEMIGAHWEILALNLKFPKVHIDTIKANHSNDIKRQCFEMLSTWWRRQDNYTEARQTLEKALVDSGRKDLVRDTSGSYDLFCWNTSVEIGVRWVAVAKQLAFTAGDIEIIQHDYRCSVVKQCFEMLTTWWRSQESDTQAMETLEKALKDMASSNPETSGSSALQQQPGSSTTQETRDDPAQLAADKCEKELKYKYTTTGSYVQILPWIAYDKRHIMDIYTKLQLEKGDNDWKGEVQSYWDIFKLTSIEGHPVIRAIFRGTAGVGKTTLIDKIAYDWARGTVDVLKRYKLVFVLKMRSLQHKSDVIDALFDQLPNENAINRKDLKSFITANPEDVLFLLDGFDEFKSTELDETEFGSILKMLNRKGEYEKCSVFVTTRPSHYDKLVKDTLIEKPFALLNVLGFSKDDIKEYVYKFYSQELPKANGLLERITSSGVLSDLAKSPMLLLLMCLLWRKNATLPDTMFRLYNQALRYIFKRKTQMSTGEISRLIIAIGKVALGGLLSSDQKLSFQEEDFEPGVLDMAIRAGILTSEEVLKGIDPCKSIYFIHKTFQEFCAAVYYHSLTSEGETQQFETFFSEVSDTAGFEYLLRFCCGDNGGPSTNSILKMLSHKVKGAGDLDDTNLQIALNCYFESQSQTLPPKELINSVIAYRFIALADLSRDHSTSLMHFLKNVTDEKKGGEKACLEMIHRLSMPGTVFRRLGEDFVNHVNRMANLHDIVVTGSLRTTQECQNELLRLISSLRLKEMMKLSTVCFNECFPTRSNMEHVIAELCNLPNLVKLDLSRNRTLHGSNWSRYHLGKIKTLNELNLGNCKLGSDDLEPLFVVLSDLPELVELDLSYNETLAGSGQSWSRLKKITTLNKLNLGNCKLKRDDLEYLVVWLSVLPKLVELDLSDNETLAGSDRAWSHLREIKTLNKLNLGYCELKRDDLEHIVVGLSKLPNIVELNLHGNETLAGSDRSWSPLREIKTLNKLNLAKYTLGSDDLEHIAVGLSDLPELVELDLSRNLTLAGSGQAWFFLREIKTLNKLNLGNCELKRDDLKHIAVGLSNLSNLVELSLYGNLTLAGSDQAWSHLRDIKTLNKLNLEQCTLGSDDLEHIAVGLSDLPKLVELDLSGNKTLAGSDRSWSHLREIKTINKLNLGNCKLGSDDLKPIAVGLSNLPKLVELDLSGNSTLAGSDRSWSHLRKIQTLNKLNLGFCKLGSNDLQPIAVGLSNLPNLVELDLSRNWTLAGSDRAWSHLRDIKTLNELNLEKCTLGSDDLEPIAVGLSDLQKFVELDLSRNMTLAGSGRSWFHLGEIKSLNKLDLRSCKLKSDDLEHIAEGLSNLPNLVELDLSINETLAGSGRSWSVLAKMKHLRKISFGFCFLTADDKTQITEAVNQMTNLKMEY